MSSRVRFSSHANLHQDPNNNHHNNNDHPNGTHSSPSFAQKAKEPLLETAHDVDAKRRSTSFINNTNNNNAKSSSTPGRVARQSNDNDDQDAQELKTEPSTRIEYASQFGDGVSGPNLASMPSAVIDKDADTPLASSSDDDDDTSRSLANFSASRKRSASRKEAGFHGKGVTTLLHTACLGAKFNDVQNILNSSDQQSAIVQLITQDALGETPLFKAIVAGSVRVVELLCEFFLQKLNYKPSIESSDDKTEPLPWNFKDKFLEVRNGKGNTPLYKAAKSGRSEIVSKLIRAGANPDVADADGLPAVCIAALNDHCNTLSALILEGQADPEARQPYTDYTPLLIATKARAVGCIRVLLGRENMCNKNARGSQNMWSAIHLAAHNDDAEVLELLLKGGCDPDAVTIDGDTALHSSAWANSYSVCEKLVNVGKADRAKENKAGQTAYDVAEERGNIKLLKLLKPPNVFEKQGCPCVVQ